MRYVAAENLSKSSVCIIISNSCALRGSVAYLIEVLNFVQKNVKNGSKIQYITITLATK